ncbi:hypothetical protein ANN_23167 [Periplaneta americana]|uniref:Uncharacterized protein n=1 Tax=Periplaneta americana TaxID=6978 RepID=A0ABQ8SKC9_PERAM|nr:hypothetical protein ANN_23167 [Periplaneta americana]
MSLGSSAESYPEFALNVLKGNFGENLNQDTWYECILPDVHTRRHCGIQELAGETVDDREPDGGRVQVAARRTVDQNRTPKNTVEGRSQPTLSASNNQC